MCHVILKSWVRDESKKLAEEMESVTRNKSYKRGVEQGFVTVIMMLTQLGVIEIKEA